MALPQNQHAAEQGASFAVVAIKKFAFVLLILLIALMVSIVVEWVGIWRWWPEQGVQHSANMVRAELAFLSKATHAAPLENPMDNVLWVIAWVDQVLAWTGISQLLESSIDVVYIAAASAINMTRVFTLRLMVMLFSLPTFLVFGLVGLTRGLVGRELRRWGGGRESSGMYHLYIKLLPETLLGLWFLYLSMPVTVNPFYLVGPAAIVFGILVANSSYRFKKYL